ncbi:mycofactocin biosynthesis glycosyltransferase MftF [Actinomadura opuntiae]|uniref:mycofactocin biosynthesis glycosyltransferase MftF n=1 Tax=Actinomadura sp. OS1-43 TaxID=604315 RepID=UPI00255AE3CB|nr:mycofactocin biosynthesis glycosyltransferase MftF [Actinomadura sp. OS1-43]MDL4819339.1 mycofactocin biosynthesis glycosyltransferase MftF [Actinomadura sp. OS1-43]
MSRFRLPDGFPVALARDTSLWSGGRVATGGAPWKVVRLAAAARPQLAALRRAGAAGLADSSPTGRALARRLLDLGMADPLPAPRPGPHDVTVVIPAYERTGELERSLAAAGDVPVIVVDDASPDPGPLRRVAEAYGARLVRHDRNRGPAAARNTGLRLVETRFAAFVDSDCRPMEGWLDVLVPHFDDPRVAAVAPRIVPLSEDTGLLARYETARSALDMGIRPALVRPGGRLGFVPTATLLVRVAAAAEEPFDEDLRLGEDVDFVWRLGDRGWNVRYEPAAQVAHTPRLHPVAWARRRHEYGTSAADLARRHPGRLAPARPSMWNLAVLVLLARGRPGMAAGVAGVTAALLARRLSELPADWSLAVAIVGKGVVADAAALGHALRREWWPLGLFTLAASPRSRVARAAAVAMLAPIALEWLRQRPSIDPVRYTVLRLTEDVAYGSGVTAASARARSAAPLLPDVRFPESFSSARARARTAAARWIAAVRPAGRDPR